MIKDISEPGLRRYLERLDSVAENPPAERHRPEIIKFIESFNEVAEKAGLEPATRDALAARAILRLYTALTRTDDFELNSFYFQCLSVFGLRSLPFFMAHLERARKQKTPVLEVLDTYPETMRALVLNDILNDPPDVHSDLLYAAEAHLKMFREMQPGQAMDFLLALSGYGKSLAFPVQEALKAGLFWEAAMQRLNDLIGRADEPGTPKTNDFIRCVALFRDPQLVKMLTDFMNGNESRPSEQLFRAFTILAKPDDTEVFRSVSKLLLHPEKNIQARALLTLAAIGPKDLGRIFAAVYKKNKALKPLLTMLLPLLKTREYQTFLESLPQERRRAAVAEAFTAAAGLDPDKMRACLEAAAEAGDFSHDSMQKLADILPQTEPSKTSEEARKSAGEKVTRNIDWETGRNNGNRNNEQTESPPGNVIIERNYRGSAFKEISLEQGEIRHADFSACSFDGVNFEAVRFYRTTFDNSLLKNCSFKKCTFERCSFEGANFFDSEFDEVKAILCNLSEAEIFSCRLIKFDAAESIFSNAAFTESELLTSRFSQSDLCRISITGGELRGIEFLRCSMENIVLRRLLAQPVSFVGCHSNIARATGLKTDSPFLLQLCFEGLFAAAEDMQGPEVPAETSSETDELIGRALDGWRMAYEIAFRKLRFMHNNKRRLDWAREKFGTEKSRFLKLAPYLLHTEVFEHVNDIPLLPISCCMSRYQPDLKTLELAERYFERVELPEHIHDPVLLHGLYTIGSVGSIAQTQSSDMDLWVCYDAEDMPESMVAGLAYKLEYIEQWAMDAFGLEVHFFLMDLNLIRNNNFGFSDSESSGSAQALLLKEEFYRTAMHVSGELPLWCVTEPGRRLFESPESEQLLKKFGEISEFVDLGGLRSIPREEFFGASLWQIVKALKSPFKSIMKFGLLEKYISAGDGEETPLLCDKLKENVHDARSSLMEVDPYMLLFKEVVEHYLKCGDRQSMQMVRLSFALKTALRAQLRKNGPVLRAEYKEMREIFAESDKSSPMHLSSFYISQDWPFDKLISMGQVVNKFVIRTYSRVREEQSGFEKVVITPEDLTKLGRKIFSTFSKRKNKIEHIPFVSFAEVPFKILHFSASGGNMGEPEHWEIQGAQKISTSQRLHLSNLRDGRYLPELLAWLTANEIYAPGMQVRGDYSISPVTTRDLSTVLQKLKNFFPASRTFNTDISETLNPERVTRAFFVLNLVKPRESAKILDVAVIYSTNWGELFCLAAPADGQGLRNDPVEYLKSHVQQSVTDPPVMECFVPTRSKCASLDLPAKK